MCFWTGRTSCGITRKRWTSPKGGFHSKASRDAAQFFWFVFRAMGKNEVSSLQNCTSPFFGKNVAEVAWSTFGRIVETGLKLTSLPRMVY